MSEKKSIFKRLKGIKNIEIVIALILAAIVLLVFFGSFGQSSAKDNQSEYSFSEYVNTLQNKIETTISNIDGVGKVSM